MVDYFANVGLQCSLHYNPADFICKSLILCQLVVYTALCKYSPYTVEAVTVDETRKVLIGEDPKQEERPKKQ